jgi:hypothetical protein
VPGPQRLEKLRDRELRERRLRDRRLGGHALRGRRFGGRWLRTLVGAAAERRRQEDREKWKESAEAPQGG